MKKTVKNITFYGVLFCFALFSFPALAEEETRNDELRERMDSLIEKAEKLAEIVEELEKQGKLPLIKEEVEYDLYLTEYINYGAENNPEEVERLQVFLNEYLHEDIPVTGYYGDMTLELVNRFQMKHANEILAPWGITEPTGYVYKTTRRKINDIKNPDVTIPIPDVATGEVAGEVDEREEEVVREEIVDDVDVEEVIDEDAEEDLKEEETVEDEEEKEDNDTLTWMVIIIGAIGFGVVVYNIYTFKPRQQQQQ